MEGILKKAVVLLLYIVVIPCLAYSSHIIYGLERAKTYVNNGKGTFYIQANSFAKKSKAKQYQMVLRSKTTYSVVLVRRRHAYAVVIGPIDSVDNVRKVSTKILASTNRPASPTHNHHSSHKHQVKHTHNRSIAQKTAKPQELSSTIISPKKQQPHDLIVTTSLNQKSKISASLSPLSTEQAPKPLLSSPYSLSTTLQKGLFMGIGGGVQYPQFNSNTSVNNGSGFPPPYDSDLYTFKKDSHPFFTLFGGYRFERENQWIPAYSIGGYYQYLLSNDVGNTITQFSTPGFTNYSYSWNITSQVLLALAKVDLFEFKHIMPYISGGIGGTYIRTSGYSESPLSGVTPRISPGYNDKTTFQFAYTVGLGIDYQIAKQFILSAGYEYLNLGNIKSGTGSGAWSGASLNLGSYHTNEIVMSVTYLFDNN